MKRPATIQTNAANGLHKAKVPLKTQGPSHRFHGTTLTTAGTLSSVKKLKTKRVGLSWMFWSSSEVRSHCRPLVSGGDPRGSVLNLYPPRNTPGRD